MEKEYIVIKTADKFTIAQWNESFKTLNESDGIYNHFFWETQEDAQNAADAYNEYDGKDGAEFIKTLT